jgi:hypothetical protein
MKSIRLPAGRPQLTAPAPGSSASHALRAALAALAAIVAVSGLLLSGAGPASASPVPPAPDPALIGTWANTNPTGIIGNIIITQTAGHLQVDEIDNCGKPGGCEQGSVPAIVFGANTASVTGDSFQANIAPNNAAYLNVLLGTLTTPGGKPVLTVQELATDVGGLVANWTSTEKFAPAAPLTPQATGTSLMFYPPGTPAPPLASLAGTWHITKPDGGLTEIIISAINSPGFSPLSVHVLGTCDPTPCDWGTTATGSTYGADVKGAPGTTFLAFYKLGFKRTVLSGTISGDGSTLTVSTYSEFTDESGRSNYVLNETFTRGG